MSSILSRKVFYGSIHQYIAALVTVIFGTLTSIYIIRELTVEDFGIYNFVLSIIVMAQAVTSLGLAPAIQRYLPECKEKNHNYLQKRIVSIAMLIRFLAGLIFISILMGASDWILNIFNLPGFFQQLFPLIALMILLLLESSLLGDATLVALFENKYWNISRTAYTCLKFILFYFSIYLGYGILGIVWCWVIVEAILFLIFLVRIQKVVFSLPTKKEEVQPLPVRRLINFTWPLLLSQSSDFFRDKATDVFILSYFLGIREVGLYSFAFGVPIMLMGFSPGSRLRGILTPLFAHIYTRTNDKQRLSYFFELVNKMIFFSMIPAFIILIILADKVIIYVFTPEYLEVTNLFILSLGLVMIMQFSYAYTSIIYTVEETKIIFFGSLFAFYNLLMDLVLIPPLGILGVIIATGSAGIMVLIYYHFTIKVKQIIELKYPWKSFIRFSVNAAVTAVIVLFLKGYIHNLASLIGILAVGGITYLGISFLNKGFDEKDRKLFNELIGRNIFVF